MEHNITVIESQLDWLTVTASSPDRRSWLKDSGMAACTLEAKREGILRAWDWRGYLGEHAGGATWGERLDSVIVQLAGPLAAELFALSYPYADHVTRIDLQVTARAEGTIVDFAQEAYNGGMVDNDANGRPWKSSLVSDNRGGSCYYSGSRCSDRFGRIYNKAAESPSPAYAGCWRWEVEVKGGDADGVARLLAGSPDSGQVIRGMVWQFYADRGTPLPWPAQGQRIPRAARASNSDVGKLLSWLRLQVSPTVRRLGESGHLRAAVDALDLAVALDYTLLPNEGDGGDHHRNPLAD